jgi:hypothetical protein
MPLGGPSTRGGFLGNWPGFGAIYHRLLHSPWYNVRVHKVNYPLPFPQGKMLISFGYEKNY